MHILTILFVSPICIVIALPIHNLVFAGTLCIVITLAHSKLYSLYSDRFTLWVIARPCRQFEPAVLQLGRAFLQIDTSVLFALPLL